MLQDEKGLTCQKCGHSYSPTGRNFKCPKCGYDELTSTERMQLLQKQIDDAAILTHKARRDARRQRTAVVVFGRFDVPTVAHRQMFYGLRAMMTDTTDAFVFVSPQGKLGHQERVRWLRVMFPGLPVVRNHQIRTASDVLRVVKHYGYQKIAVMVGVQDASVFARLGQGKSWLSFIVVPCESLTSVNTHEAATWAAAADGNFEGFCAGVPTTNRVIAKQLFTRIRTQGDTRREETGPITRTVRRVLRKRPASVRS